MMQPRTQLLREFLHQVLAKAAKPTSPPCHGCPADQRPCGPAAQRLSEMFALSSLSHRNTLAMPDSLRDIARQLDQFATDRDWQQFHSPKNLASALVVEFGELLEHFQWLTEAQTSRAQ